MAQYLTDIIYFSLEPDNAGTLNTDRYTPDVAILLNQIKKSYPVKIHIAIGGWGRSDGFPAVTKHAIVRRFFIDHLHQFLQSNGDPHLGQSYHKK